MLSKKGSWRGILGLLVVVALGGDANASILWRRGKQSKAITDNTCIDVDVSNPPPIRFGYPSWKTADDPNCATPFPVDEHGQCLSALSPENRCSSFCQQTNGWFFGEPIDSNSGRWCEVGQSCTRTISISKTNGDSTTINSGESYLDNTVRTNSSEAKDATSISMGVKAEAGIGVKMPMASGVATAEAGIKASTGWEGSFSRSRTQAWSRTVTESKSYAIMNQTTFSINIAESDSMSRPAWSNAYCGGWFAVPMVGISCGRGAHGREAINKEEKTSTCVLQDPEQDVFSHCFSYTFNDYREQDMTKYRMAFVLRDCNFGYILPGEWQPVAFQHSFHPEVYTKQHIQRYGYNNLPSDWPEKPNDAAWVLNGIPSAFTKTLGPEDYTIKVCSSGDYCVRHKLTDGNCHNFPRGHPGVKSVDIVSAFTTPGNCCTLFSKAECHGLAQNVRGNLTHAHLLAVGYKSQAHSVVCNVDQYCNPDVIDTLDEMS